MTFIANCLFPMAVLMIFIATPHASDKYFQTSFLFSTLIAFIMFDYSFWILGQLVLFTQRLQEILALLTKPILLWWFIKGLIETGFMIVIVTLTALNKKFFTAPAFAFFAYLNFFPGFNEFFVIGTFIFSFEFFDVFMDIFDEHFGRHIFEILL